MTIYSKKIRHCYIFCILGIQSGKFAHFDLGKSGNIKKYGQETPPEFSIEAMNVPIASYWSQDDWMAQPPDLFRWFSVTRFDYNGA